MNKELKAHIEYLLCINIESVRPISGGDISKAYLLSTESERFFCKVHSGENAFTMFQAEKAGLEAIAQTKTIATPKILCCERLQKGAFLLLEYVESRKPNTKDMTLMGHQLAALHQLSSSKQFGWETNNFIGSLPQSNKTYPIWTEFYLHERLLPQLKMAQDSQLLSSTEIPSEVQFVETSAMLFPKVRPSLVHGDLWSGNCLISEDGKPYLVDPAVYFGHHEVDIAMTKLFGGFECSFYDAHMEHFPKIGGEKQRADIYQLYYLLVHLNLFGASYKFRVIQILKTYF